MSGSTPQKWSVDALGKDRNPSEAEASELTLEGCIQHCVHQGWKDIVTFGPPVQYFQRASHPIKDEARQSIMGHRKTYPHLLICFEFAIRIMDKK